MSLLSLQSSSLMPPLLLLPSSLPPERLPARLIRVPISLALEGIELRDGLDQIQVKARILTPILAPFKAPDSGPRF